MEIAITGHMLYAVVEERHAALSLVWRAMFDPYHCVGLRGVVFVASQATVYFHVWQMTLWRGCVVCLPRYNVIHTVC